LQFLPINCVKIVDNKVIVNKLNAVRSHLGDGLSVNIIENNLGR